MRLTHAEVGALVLEASKGNKTAADTSLGCLRRRFSASPFLTFEWFVLVRLAEIVERPSELYDKVMKAIAADIISASKEECFLGTMEPDNEPWDEV